MRNMRKFKDINTGEIITEEELRKEFDKLYLYDPENYDYSFEWYILNCTDKNGTLEEVRKWVGNAEVVDSLLDLPKIGERDPYRGLCVSVELRENQENYAIYRVKYLMNNCEYFDNYLDIAYWSYAIHKNHIK